MESLTKRVTSPLRYFNHGDIVMRLKDTVVTYDRRPCYVKNIEPVLGDNANLHIACVDIKANKPFMCHSSDELLDIQSLPMGWIKTTEGTVMFLARTTRTSQRQGIHLGSILCFYPKHESTHFGFGWNDFTDLRVLLPMFDNEVSSIAQATESQEGGVLNREWALVPLGRNHKNRFFTVYHRCVEVGTYIKDQKRFFFRRGRLTKTRKFQLQEILYHPANTGVRYAISEQA